MRNKNIWEEIVPLLATSVATKIFTRLDLNWEMAASLSFCFKRELRETFSNPKLFSAIDMV